jgi:hypothetical protein
MTLRPVAWAGFVFFLCGAAAVADEWKVAKLEGGAVMFRAGAWVKLSAGAVIADGATTRTLSDSAMKLTRDGESIALSAKTEVQILDHPGERYTTVREHFGAVGVEANVENVLHFEVQTPLLSAVVKGTIFGVETSSDSSTVAVTRGVVEVTDFKRHVKADVRAGDSAKVTQSRVLEVEPASATDPDTVAATAAAAAARASNDTLAGGAPDTTDKDTKVVSAAKPVARDGAGAGDVDPDAVAGAAGAAMGGGGMMNESEVEAAAKIASRMAVLPKDDGIRRARDTDFSWTKVVYGKRILKPVPELISQMKGADRYAVFFLAGIVYLIVCWTFSAIIKEASFGFFANTAIILAASMIGVLARDYLFYDARNLQFEPYMTLSLVIGSMLIGLTASCVARVRL